MIPGKGAKHPTFWRSFLFAIQGFRLAMAQERNFKVMMGGAAFAVAMGLILRIDALSWAIIILCCGVVMAAELLNTAIEKVVDLVSPEFHPLAGQAKDISAAAVWVLCVLVAVVGTIVYVHAFLT